MRCPNCGAEADSKFCPYCGSQMPYSGPENVYTDNSQQTIINNYYINPGDMPGNGMPNNYYNNMNGGFYSPKSRIITIILAFVTGYFGGHYFYLGRPFMGFLYLFTVGLFGFGYLYDLYRSVVGTIPDANGLPVANW